MAKGTFEISGQPNLLSGELYADVLELGTSGEPANATNVIRIDQDWIVRFHWGLKGSLKRMICGEWCLSVHLESIGDGPEFTLPKDYKGVHIDLNPCGSCEYDYDFRVPAGTVTEEHCSTPYKLVATVTYLDACDRPGPMAGFVEGPIIQFYNPGPK